jgi:hypothetical protein
MRSRLEKETTRVGEGHKTKKGTMDLEDKCGEEKIEELFIPP